MESVATRPPDAADPIVGARRGVILTSISIGILAPIVLAGARWPLWWTDIAPEQTPMTWLQSVVLVVAAVAAALAVVAARVRGIDGPRRWLIVAAGFSVLAVDERFAIHERVRDGVLAPRGISVPFLPWVAPGDFLLLGVAVVGVTMLPVVLRLFRPDPLAMRAVVAGVVLAAVAVGVDSIDPASWTVAQERLQQTLEECVELASGLSLLTAVLLRSLSLAGGRDNPAARVLTTP
jgi:hypothetical protein